MQSFQESLTAWATLLGSIISLVGLIQSRTWLAGLGTICLLVSIAAGLYARRERAIVNSANVTIDGQNIESLNIANLRRRVNSSLVVQDARHTASIKGPDLNVVWQYSGYCKAEGAAFIEFSVDSDNYVPFSQLDCFGYDLLRDPAMRHKVRPLLLGADGISKKIMLPFLAPLAAQEPFCVLLKCALPGSMKAGLEYYTSTLSFDQRRGPAWTTRLIFFGRRPPWVRLYQCDNSGTARLVKDLQPSEPARERTEYTEYTDTSETVEGQCARIYVFRRDGLLQHAFEADGKMRDAERDSVR